MCAIKIDCGTASEPVGGPMISLSRNRILIKLFCDLNPRITPNVLPVSGHIFVGWLARPRHGIEIENKIGVDGPGHKTGSSCPRYRISTSDPQPIAAIVLSHRWSQAVWVRPGILAFSQIAKRPIRLLPNYQFGGLPTGYCSKSSTEPVISSLSSLAK